MDYGKLCERVTLSNLSVGLIGILVLSVGIAIFSSLANTEQKTDTPDQVVAEDNEQEPRPAARAAWTVASWYGGGKNLQGGVYVARGMVCAANLPEAGVERYDWLRITRPGHGQIIVKVNDFGPDRTVFPDRGIDLSPDAAKKLGIKKIGYAPVYVERLGRPESK